MKHIFIITAELINGEPHFEFDDDTADQLLGGCLYDDDKGEYLPVPNELNSDDSALRKRIASALGIK